MDALELERRIYVMVKIIRFPSRCGMTSITIGRLPVFIIDNHDFFELPYMNILMAILASSSLARKSKVFYRGLPFQRLVAGQTRNLNMAAGQNKPGFIVVELEIIPAFDLMTGFATSQGQVFVHRSFMRVAVASGTAGRFKDEFRGRVAVDLNFRMTADTGYGQMRARKRIIGFIMVFYPE